MKLRVRRITTFVMILIAAPFFAEAQQFVCGPIVPGDTASGLALRLTGNAAIAYTERFQIRNPARGRFVPKSQYERLSTRWQACVASEIAGRARNGARHRWRNVAVAGNGYGVAASSLPAGLLPSPVPRSQQGLPSRGRGDARFAWTVGLTVSLTLFAGSVVFRRHAAMRRIPPDMQRTGERFLNAFARPLMDPSSHVAPIRARLRFVPRAQQLEIFIAPNNGRRYPNLYDHKSNVEYDVNRVVQLLGDHLVVVDRLRTEGQWVVVPIRRVDLK